jgi:hypothetical protein
MDEERHGVTTDERIDPIAAKLEVLAQLIYSERKRDGRERWRYEWNERVVAKIRAIEAEKLHDREMAEIHEAIRHARRRATMRTGSTAANGESSTK